MSDENDVVDAVVPALTAESLVTKVTLITAISLITETLRLVDPTQDGLLAEESNLLAAAIINELTA